MEAAVAAPPAPAPSAPAPAPAAAPEPMSESYADLDAMLAEQPPTPEPKAPPKADKAPPESKPDDEPSKPEPEAKAPESRPEKMGPKQLREAYEALKAKHRALESEHDTLKRTASQPKDDPEKKEIAERAERYSKRAAELEAELKFAKYEKSDEYQEKYYKPYEQAFGSGRAEAASIKVLDAEGNPRQGTPEDFDTYMMITDPEAAADFAEKVFGKHKATMEYWRNQVRALGARSQTAIEEYRKKGSEREKQDADRQATINKAAAEYWQTLNKTALEKYPNLFKAEDEDAKGKELLTKGFNLADRAFGNGAPTQDGQKPLNPAELMQLRNAMRNKFAAFDYQVYKLRKAEARVKELEASLAEYEKSVPGPGEGKGKGEPVSEENWERQLEEMATP